MSTLAISDQEKTYKKSFHRRNDSGELDVFEAANYFSGATEFSSTNGTTYTPQKISRGGRISLDMPLPLRESISLETNVMDQKQNKEKKYKQPSSPGGRLASFLNSLFNQTSSKKEKKAKSTTTHEILDESAGGRRKRRSSISDFGSTPNSKPKPIFSSSSSGFRTPPPYTNVVSLPKHNVCGEIRSTSYASSLDGKVKSTYGCPEKFKNLRNGTLESERIWGGKYPLEKREFRKFSEVDDGAESDSSSDLFELENYDLGTCSSGLPVFETTHVGSIKRGAPITNGST